MLLNELLQYMKDIKAYLENVCLEVTLPGFKYVVDASIPVWQRLMFGLFILGAAGITIVNIIFAWNYSKQNYTITNIESLQYPLWNLTYPAVYICNLNRISLKAVNRMLDNWIYPGNMTREEVMNELRTLPIITYKMMKTKNYEVLQKLITMNNASLWTLADELSGSCDDFLEVCRWHRKEIDCNKYFSKVITVDGFCCTFNAVYYRNYSRPFEWKSARRVNSCGYSDSLVITVKTNLSDYFTSLSASYGYSIYLKNPFLYPDSSDISKLMSPNTVLLLSFLAKKIFTTNAVKLLSESYRECYGTEQRLLAGFQAYSYHNCIVECRINITYSICGCVPIVYPKTSDHQRYCEISDIPCLQENKELLQALYHGIPVEKYHGKAWKKDLMAIDYSMMKPCGCLPECSITIYEADSNYSPLIESVNNVNKSFAFNRLYIFNDDVVSTRIRRDTFYTTSVLLGTCGGLLGFFLGMSIICVPELLFFLVFHPLFMLIRKIIFKCFINGKHTEMSVNATSVFIVQEHNVNIKKISNVNRYNNRLTKTLHYRKTKIPKKSTNLSYID